MYMDGPVPNMSDSPDAPVPERCPPDPGACPPLTARGASGGPKNGSVIRYDGLSNAGFGIKIPLSLAASSLTCRSTQRNQKGINFYVVKNNQQ